MNDDVAATPHTDALHLRSERLTARIDTFGAQLRSLRFDDVEYLWDASEPWNYSAPVLFPIISGLPNNELMHEGGRYPIPSHGFARRSQWAVTGPATLELAADDATRAQYPFNFRLTATFTLTDTLTVSHTVCNEGDSPMPFLLGGHPALRWPLPGAAVDAEHVVSWDSGGDTMRQAVNGLRPDRHPSPAVDGRLVLDREQFAVDAMLFDDISPREVRYTAAGAAAVTFSYESYPRLGLWSKAASGDFLCIEPWSGYPAPHGFDGDIMELPEATVLAPGGRADYDYSIRIEEQ